jgi:hypothetical protein
MCLIKQNLLKCILICQVENVHRWLDIAIPKGIASNLAFKNNTFFNFAFQLARYVFKQEGAQYFSRSGTTNASNGMDTLALPINILEGFLGEMELHVVLSCFIL